MDEPPAVESNMNIVTVLNRSSSRCVSQCYHLPISHESGNHQSISLMALC